MRYLKKATNFEKDFIISELCLIIMFLFFSNYKILDYFFKLFFLSYWIVLKFYQPLHKDSILYREKRKGKKN